MPVESSLLQLQRRFLSALQEPIVDDSRARTELPSRPGSVSAAFIRTAEDLIAPSPTMNPVERLELYHRQYWYRLLDSLAEDFPALRRLLGEVDFWRLIEAYVEANPPCDFTLRHLGAGLADFLAARPDGVPHAIHAEDLARLEYALCLAFEGVERPPVAAKQFGQARLALQPHLRLLALRTPADTLWLVLGFGTRFAAAALTTVVITAMASAHGAEAWRSGRRAPPPPSNHS